MTDTAGVPFGSGAGAMTVVHLVLTGRFAGIERHVTDTAAVQAAAGHRVVVVCAGSAPAVAAALDATSPGRVEVVAVPGWRRAAAVVATRRPDVVHAHTAAGVLAAAVGTVGRSAAVVATNHFAVVRWSPADGHGHPLLRVAGSGTAVPGRSALLGWANRQVGVELAFSRYVADRVGVPARVAHPGVATFVDVAGATDRDRRVLVAQRLEPAKDTEVALRAWQASGLRHHGWILEVAGDGSLSATLRRLAASLGIADSVEFTGQVTDISRRMATAAMVLAPARAEPFGLTVVEAMASGVPVVAAGAAGHLETVGPVAGAAVFTPGDAAGAAGLLDALGGDPDRRDRLATAQRARQRERFDLHRQTAALEAVYRVAARR